MQAVIVFALLLASSQAFLFGPGGLFGAPAGGCDPCAAARAAPYYPPQPTYQAPAYVAPQPVYSQPQYGYQTAPVQHYQQQPAPVQYQTAVAEPQPEPMPQPASGGYAQAPPPPPPASYARGPAAVSGYKKF